MDDFLANPDFVDSIYMNLLLRPADDAGKMYYVSLLETGCSRLDVVKKIATSAEFFGLLCQRRFGPQTGSQFLQAAAPGHFYSPIPSDAAVEQLASVPESYDESLCVSVNLNVPKQLALLEALAPLAIGLDISDRPNQKSRYYADNGSFAPGDATLLAAVIRHFRPRAIIEVGAGFSTAMMLDTIDGHLRHHVAIEAVDPEPERVTRLLKSGDERVLTLRKGLVQEIPLERFVQLRSGDILFIDSSHVLKLGSDVLFLLVEVLPRLAAGVLVHFHDIAWPFEYPVNHYRHGWAWNEAHALRLMLADSSRYELLLWSDYLVRAQRDMARSVMPELLRQPPGIPPEGNTACSFWLRVREV